MISYHLIIIWRCQMISHFGRGMRRHPATPPSSKCRPSSKYRKSLSPTRKRCSNVSDGTRALEARFPHGLGLDKWGPSKRLAHTPERMWKLLIFPSKSSGHGDCNMRVTLSSACRACSVVHCGNCTSKGCSRCVSMACSVEGCCRWGCTAVYDARCVTIHMTYKYHGVFLRTLHAPTGSGLHVPPP